MKMDTRMDVVTLQNLHADAFGKAVLGSVVSETLQRLLRSAFKIWENRTAPGNIKALQKLLGDLEPAVHDFGLREGKGPADEEWLRRFQVELAEAQEVIDVCKPDDRNIFERVNLSKRSLILYGNIRRLLSDAPEHLFSGPMAITRITIDNGEVSETEKQNNAEVNGTKKQNHVTVNESEKQKLLDENATVGDLEADQKRLEHRLRSIIQRQESSSLQMSILSRLTASQMETVYGPRSSSARKPKRRLLEHRPSNPDVSDDHESCYSAGMALAQSAYKVSQPTEAFGDEIVTKKLINHLLHHNYTKWVGVWGAEGIGKSFTARKVYYDPSIQEHFSRQFWCTTSKSQPNSKLLLRQLLGALEGGESASQLPDDLESAKSVLRSKVDQLDRFLLVLDDVREADVLADFEFLSQSSKVVIIVTARNKRILSNLLPTVEVFKVQRLSPKDSWKFLASHVSVAREVEHRAKQVADECEGLPLLIQTFGEWMAYQRDLDALREAGQITESFIDLLRRNPTELTEQENSFVQMQVSVDGLSASNPRLRYFLSFFEAGQTTV